MSTTPYPGPDEVIIPSRIYFNDGKRIDVKVWPKTIQLTGPTKDLNKVFKTLEEYDDWWHQFKKKNPDAFRKDANVKSFIQDKDQAEEMITQYTCYYNAIKRWESNHKETEILHQLEISNLLEQLKNN